MIIRGTIINRAALHIQHGVFPKYDPAAAIVAGAAGQHAAGQSVISLGARIRILDRQLRVFANGDDIAVFRLRAVS